MIKHHSKTCVFFAHVPPRLREYAKLDKRAMLVGQLNKFQLWDEDTWNAVAEADLAAAFLADHGIEVTVTERCRPPSTP